MPAISTVSAPVRSDWVFFGIAAVILAVSFAVIFSPEVVAAINVWISSTAFNHCFLVIPVVAYLLWERRHVFSTQLPQPLPWILVLAIPAVAGWFTADRLGIMEGRQLMAMTLFQIMAAAMMGWRLWRLLAGPLLYLYFLVPFGEFLTPVLQNITAHFVVVGLNLVNIPNFSNGLVIEIPEGAFKIAEACAGFRFLIASEAFGVLYALLMYTSLRRRACFIIASLVVPIFANGVRAFGIIYLAHHIGAAAVELDHVSWGWYFFSVVTLLLILCGLPFRQEREHHLEAEERSSPVRPNYLATVGSVALVLAAATGLKLTARSLDTIPLQLNSAGQSQWPVMRSCMSIAAEAPIRLERNWVETSATYDCSGERYTTAIYSFAARASAGPILAVIRSAANAPDASRTNTATLKLNDVPWQITGMTRDDGRIQLVATSLWIEDRPATADFAARVRQALNSLRFQPHTPHVVTVTYLGSGDAWDGMKRFLNSFPSPNRLAIAPSKAPPMLPYIEPSFADADGSNLRHMSFSTR